MTPPRGSRNGSHGQRPSEPGPLGESLPTRKQPGGRPGRTAPPYPYGPAVPSYPYGRPAPTRPSGRPRPPPAIPSGAGDMRRYLAVALDCYLCLLTAGLLVRPYAHADAVGRAVALTLLPALALSFANQVLLTAAVRASAGKLIMGVRVIGLPDVGRPGMWRLVRRWLYGLCRLGPLPWHWLRSLFAGPVGDGGGGGPYEDVAGLRQVRHRDLVAYRAAVAGREV